MRVVLKLSDPWDMGESLGWPQIAGVVVKEGESWLIEIDQPFEYGGVEYRFVVVQARHVGKVLNDSVSEDLPCNMTRIASERAASEDPCDLSWWRGGHAMIGSITSEAG